MSSDSSLTTWIEGIKAGESQCALRLHLAIHDRLLRLARHSLGRPQRWIDEEDVALSAFHSFCNRAEQGKFDRLHSRDDLGGFWFALHTASPRLRPKRKVAKTGAGWFVVSPFLEVKTIQWQGASIMWQVSSLHQKSHSLSPKSAKIIGCARRRNASSNCHLEDGGFLDTEIAEKLGCVTRTVERKVNRIREKWTEFFESPRKLD